MINNTTQTEHTTDVISNKYRYGLKTQYIHMCMYYIVSCLVVVCSYNIKNDFSSFWPYNISSIHTDEYTPVCTRGS